LFESVYASERQMFFVFALSSPSSAFFWDVSAANDDVDPLLSYAVVHEMHSRGITFFAKENFRPAKSTTKWEARRGRLMTSENAFSAAGQGGRGEGEGGGGEKRRRRETGGGEGGRP